MAAMRLSIDIIINGDAVAARITARRLGSIPGRCDPSYQFGILDPRREATCGDLGGALSLCT
jgi:hypothetical protein